MQAWFKKMRDAATAKKSDQSGFTLMEILVAVSVFAIISAMSTTIYINITREQKRVNLQNAIFEDARLMLERVSAQARQHGIDYEEYYSQLVVQKGFDPDNDNRVYGINYGDYGSQFFNPGLTIIGVSSPREGDHPDHLGAECGDGVTLVEDDPSCIIYNPSLDVNTGLNPYDEVMDSTAFCSGDCSGTGEENIQDQLYLISTDASRKIIFALEQITTADEDEYSLAMVELVGEDSDSNGVVDTYKCDESKGFNCLGAGNLPTRSDLRGTGDAADEQDFVPISSKTTTISSLKFIISPIEDPRKAYNETGEAIQVQPHITILLTVKPTAAAQERINFKDAMEVTVQTSITPRMYTEVKSFPPCLSMENFIDKGVDCLGD